MSEQGLGTADVGPVTVGPLSQIRLHPLARRSDGDEWIVGRAGGRTVVALPAVGIRAIELLEDGLSPSCVQSAVIAETGEEVDILQFIDDLRDLGFVESVDGCPVSSEDPTLPSLRWLRPEHVTFLLRPAAALVPAVVVLAACMSLVCRPALVPIYSDLFWCGDGSVVLASGAAAGWTIVFLHEFAHLAMARAVGVPATIRFGTRLQFLVLQTDISGIETARRRHRLTAYSAGIAVNLVVAAAAVLVLALLPPETLAHRLLAASVLWALLPVPFEFLVFMRTDVYFVLQDVTGCRNLHADGRAYTAHLLRRLLPGGRYATDPTASLPDRERRTVRLYTVVLIFGTTACLTMLTFVTVPTDLRLFTEAAGEVTAGRGLVRFADGLTVLVVLVTVQGAWVYSRLRDLRRRYGRRPVHRPVDAGSVG